MLPDTTASLLLFLHEVCVCVCVRVRMCVRAPTYLTVDLGIVTRIEY